MGWALCALELAFVVLEKFHLAQPFFGFCFALVGTAEILSLFGENFVAFFHFLDHRAPPSLFSTI
jgi:hypothetical protein